MPPLPDHFPALREWQIAISRSREVRRDENVLAYTQSQATRTAALTSLARARALRSLLSIPFLVLFADVRRRGPLVKYSLCCQNSYHTVR